jgi:hypothetical protein
VETFQFGIWTETERALPIFQSDAGLIASPGGDSGQRQEIRLGPRSNQRLEQAQRTGRFVLLNRIQGAANLRIARRGRGGDRASLQAVYFHGMRGSAGPVEFLPIHEFVRKHVAGESPPIDGRRDFVAGGVSGQCKTDLDGLPGGKLDQSLGIGRTACPQGCPAGSDDRRRSKKHWKQHAPC